LSILPGLPPPPTVTVYAVDTATDKVDSLNPPAPPPPLEAPPPPATTKYSTDVGVADCVVILLLALLAVL
jgi:hypothetical protein